MNKSRVYLDYNATAPLLSGAREAMESALRLVGNPSSVHMDGRYARSAIDRARRQVGELCGADPSAVIFTSGATEAAAMVLTPHFKMGRSDLRIGHLYVSAVEHPCILCGGRFSAEDISVVGVDANGIISLDALDMLLRAHPAEEGRPMLALQLANNETGVLQPLEAAGEIVKAHGGLMVVDAVQAVGRMRVDIRESGADFIILSSHKIGGPKGAGALVCAGEVLMPTPLIPGGGQERGHRSGTENPAAIAGFGVAAAEAVNGLEARAAKMGQMRDRLEVGIQTIAPDSVIYGQDVARLVNTTFFALPGLKAETAQIAFDLEGVSVSAGSACSSGKVGPSHVLEAMGVNPEPGGIRVSIGAGTNHSDITRFLGVFEPINEKREKKKQENTAPV
ncbi:MAG: cysteine desulfurase family protein [Pseudomonadota bacterium]